MGIARNLARISADGSGAIAAGNLTNAVPADGSITNAKIASMAATKLTGTVPDANAPSGSVIQTVQSDTTGVVSYTNSNGEFFTVSITPSSASNKILVSGNFIWGADNPNGYFTLERSIGGGSYSVLSNVAGYDESPSGNAWSAPINYLDSPNTTSAVTYRIYWYHVGQNGGTMFLNRNQSNDSNVLYASRTGRSVFITQEIAA